MIPCACLSGSHVTFPLNFFPVLFPVFFSRTLFSRIFFSYFFTVLFSPVLFFSSTIFPYFFPVPFSRIFFLVYFFPVIFFFYFFLPYYFFPLLFFPVLFSRTFSKVATFEIQRFKISVRCFSSTCRCGISIQTSPVGLPLDGWGARMHDLKGSGRLSNQIVRRGVSCNTSASEQYIR